MKHILAVLFETGKGSGGDGNLHVLNTKQINLLPF